MTIKKWTLLNVINNKKQPIGTKVLEVVLAIGYFSTAVLVFISTILYCQSTVLLLVPTIVFTITVNILALPFTDWKRFSFSTVRRNRKKSSTKPVDVDSLDANVSIERLLSRLLLVLQKFQRVLCAVAFGRRLSPIGLSAVRLCEIGLRCERLLHIGGLDFGKMRRNGHHLHVNLCSRWACCCWTRQCHRHLERQPRWIGLSGILGSGVQRRRNLVLRVAGSNHEREQQGALWCIGAYRWRKTLPEPRLRVLAGVVQQRDVGQNARNLTPSVLDWNQRPLFGSWQQYTNLHPIWHRFQLIADYRSICAFNRARGYLDLMHQFRINPPKLTTTKFGVRN